MAVVRSIHVGATVITAGVFAFQFLVAPGPHGREWTAAVRYQLGRCLGSAAWWGLSVAFLTWLIWLALVATTMSGGPSGQLPDLGVLRTVLAQTAFGYAWTLRCALIVLLAIVLARRGNGPSTGHPLGAGGALIAAALLAGLAWTGHAVGTEISLRPLHLASDALHLLGAGVWLGALVPLLFVLSRTRTQPTQAWDIVAVTATRRFSRLGVVAVATLLVTGLINGWLLVGSWAAVAGTFYGQLVAAKLALFSLILVIAAFNRLQLVPTMRMGAARARDTALHTLWRNVILEISLGAIIVAVVGVLGTMPPSAHLHGVVRHQMHTVAD